VPQNVKRRRATQKRGQTPQLILDVAEALFAERGFDGVAIRDITNAAGVPLNLARYYFENKQALFKRVIARRSREINLRRREALLGAQADGAPRVETLLAAFLQPYLDAVRGNEPGWKNYNRLIAHLALDKRWATSANRELNENARLYRIALSAALPKMSQTKISLGLAFAMHLTVMFTASRRWDSLGTKAGQVASIERQGYANMVSFLAGGLKAWAKEPTKAEALHDVRPRASVRSKKRGKPARVGPRDTLKY
jgi:AcrR family transcriptional regulator